MAIEPLPHHLRYASWRSPVSSRPDQRVSDTERQAVVEQLRLNTADGRLDMDEFGDRVEAALAARTGAELTSVLRDLPNLEPPEEAQARRRRKVRGILVPYIVINAFLVLVWALTGIGAAGGASDGGAGGYFWPIWVILGWGVMVVLSLAAVAGSGDRRHRSRSR